MSDKINDDENSEENEQSFAAMLDAYSPGLEADLNIGDKIKGKIITIGQDSVFVDTGTKIDGVVDKAELLDQGGDTHQLLVADQHRDAVDVHRFARRAL